MITCVCILHSLKLMILKLQYHNLGVFLWIIPVVITLFFSDDKALGKESEASLGAISNMDEV